MFFDTSLLKYIKNPANYKLSLDSSNRLTAIERNYRISNVANFSISQENFKIFLISAAGNPVGSKVLLALRKYEIKPDTIWSKELYFNLFRRQELVSFERNLIDWVEKHIGDASSYMQAIDAARKIRQAYIFESSSLNLSDHYLLDLPDCIGSLRSLQEIILDNNNLKNLPDTMINMSRLEKLNLRNNLFSSVPEVLYNYKLLKELNLGCNNIRTGLCNLQSCSQLSILHLDKNSISEDILNFPELKELCYLSLGSNQINELGGKLFCCMRIRYLDLSDNQINHLPKEIKELTDLINLNLRMNRIQVIPDYLDYLKNLENLDISENKIENLPSYWKNWRELISFSCDGNPIKKEIEFFELVLFFSEESKKYLDDDINNFTDDEIYKYFIKPGLQEDLLDHYRKLKSAYVETNITYKLGILKNCNNIFNLLISAKKEQEDVTLGEIIDDLIEQRFGRAIHFSD